MSLEQEMRNEITRLEKELIFLDDELEKLHNRIVELMAVRKKKDHDLRVLKSNFGENDEKEYQTTLAKLLEREGIKHI